MRREAAQKHIGFSRLLIHFSRQGNIASKTMEIIHVPSVKMGQTLDSLKIRFTFNQDLPNLTTYFQGLYNYTVE